MPVNIRLTKEEQKNLRDKSIEINKLLVSNSKAPLKESELLHLILSKSTRYVKINKDGEIYLDV